jgi:DNA primase
VPGRVPEHVIQQIVRSVDFVRLAGRWCDLKKKGRNYWGLCPFHEEKTPSFSVDAENGLYYCFGCKEGGNAFTLLQKLEGLTFSEALARLAAEAGVDLSQYAGESGPSRGEMGRLREVNELATSFYQKCLEKGRGSKGARDYLSKRGFTGDSVRAWRLGYAPEGWDNFLKCARGRSYEDQWLVRAGLALERPAEGRAAGCYDRFRNRLMFPIADATGRTIAFGARALKAEDEPKYLNSPETPLFSKGRSFFGLAQAKEAMRSSKTAVVLEGYTDVIMAHQCGVQETVAVLGTALTEDHARTLGRLCERVVLVFDADEAGQKSAVHSIDVLLNSDLQIYVAELPAGQDPCDFLLAEGGEAFRKRLKESRGFFEFRLGVARSQRDTATIEGKMAAFRDVAEMALVVRENARRDMIVRWLAQELGVRESHAWDYVRQRDVRRQVPAPQRAAGGSGRLSADQALPGELLGLLLCHPEAVSEAAERLNSELLPDCAEKQVLERVLSAGAKGGPWETRRFVNSLDDPVLAAAASRAMAEEEARAQRIKEASAEQRLRGYLDYVERKEMAAAGATVPADDEDLREYVRRLKEQDERSAPSG